MTIHLLYFHVNRGQESSMEKRRFNSMLSNEELEYRCELSKSMDSLGPIENTCGSEDPIITDTYKKISSWSESTSSSYNNVDRLFGVRDIRNFISEDTFLVKDSNGDGYSIYFDIENQIFEIDNDHSFLSEVESAFYSYWNNHINSCIDSYLRSQIHINSCIDSYLRGESGNSSENENSSIRTNTNGSDFTESSNENGSDFTESSDENGRDFTESSKNLEGTQKYRHLWVQCENCYGLNYKKFFKSKMNICEQCGYHLKMSSSDRIELSVDPGTWDPLDEHMFSLDAIGFDLEEEPCIESLEFASIYKDKKCVDSFESYLSSKDKKECMDSFESYLSSKDKECMDSFESYLSSKDNECMDSFESYLSSNDKKVCLDSFESYLSSKDKECMDPFEFNLSSKDKEERMDYYESYLSSKDKEYMDSFESYLSSKDKEDKEHMDSYQRKVDSYQREMDSGEEPSKECIGFLKLDSAYKACLDSFESYLSSKDKECMDSYQRKLDFSQRETGLTEAVQTGTGQLNGIPIAIGVMDFRFMGGSMGSVVGEKITRLVEYATHKFLPLILVCASGGARMQEGSLSLMQMAKISSALYDYQSNKKLFYVSILTSPTTGGVTASFGMLGDIIIAEPDAYIAFAGKRVIEQTLNIIVPEGSQEAEYLFGKGLFDPIVPRNLLKGVLDELFQLHAFFPSNKNSIK
uniref:Acetyl-coenzyme A carboxylase carboxyl transferase subunit beta, chloroplastic n=2 Tax=Pentapetalae TaxID=1437201 RepID=A0A8K1J9I3_9MAGN|nr:acetyl-CoA carboxylase carboxyltransferase beta subunit [Peltoboykinia tellimoides]